MAAKKTVSNLINDTLANGTDPLAVIAKLEKIIENQQKKIDAAQTATTIPFESAFKALIAQFCSTLDGDIDGYILGTAADGIDAAETYEPRDNSENTDKASGHDRPSTRDMGLQIVLSQLTQTMHNQLMGRDGKNSAVEFLNNLKNRRDTPQFRERYAKGNLGRSDMTLLRQLEVQSDRVAMLSMMLDTFQSTYEAVTRMKWKPYSADTNNAVGERAKPFDKASIDRIMGL